MKIGLTGKQREQLEAMLPNIEDSVASLKRLIADSKDRTRALQRLSDAAEAQKRHAKEVGIPFNAEAFAQRRKELDALPEVLTFEEGQLASFSAMSRAISVILDGPYQRDSTGGNRNKPKRSVAKKEQGRTAPNRSAPERSATVKKTAKKTDGKAAKSARTRKPPHAARPSPRQKPLPLSLGS